jgi:excisionase family DNA binding protein
MSSIERILYTRQESAKLLSISVDTLDRLIAAKKLTARRVGRKVLLQHVELQKFSRKDTTSFNPERPQPRQDDQDSGEHTEA